MKPSIFVAFALHTSTLSLLADDKLLSVDPVASIVTVVREGQLKTFWIKQFSEITMNGVKVPLDKVHAGMSANISFSDAQTISRLAIKSADAPQANPRTLVLRLRVDGSEVVRIKDGQLTIEHGDAGPPDTISVNGVDWQPKWNGKMSDAFTAFTPPMEGFQKSNIHFRQIAGRSKVKMKPVPTGNFEKIVTLEFNDSVPGSDSYEIRLDW